MQRQLDTQPIRRGPPLLGLSGLLLSPRAQATPLGSPSTMSCLRHPGPYPHALPSLAHAGLVLLRYNISPRESPPLTGPGTRQKRTPLPTGIPP